MFRIFEILIHEFFNNPKFRLDQNDIALDAYNTLSKSYKNKDNEVKTVEKLCSNLNGKECGKAKLYAEKIHGNASKVEFYNASNSLVKKELGDMVIISLATCKSKITFEKIAFIQNKKETKEGSEKWKIDQDQLFLLNVFPTFNGVSGIFGNEKKLLCQMFLED